MSVVTTYTCDHCGTSKDSHLGFYHVCVEARPAGGENRYDIERSALALWCRNCLVDAGLKMPLRDYGHEAPAVKPTVEDLIRQIVQEMQQQ